MNKVILIGRLTRDPEVRYTQSGKAVASFALAVDRRYKKRDEDGNSQQQTADFINVVAWNQTAELCGNHLSKGRRIGIEGRIQSRSYEAQDGTKRYVTEVVIDNLEFLDSKNAPREDNGYADNSYSSGGGYRQESARQKVAPPEDSFGADVNDEEIPF